MRGLVAGAQGSVDRVKENMIGERKRGAVTGFVTSYIMGSGLLADSVPLITLCGL